MIGDHTAIEVKATQRVSPKDFRGLKALAEEKRCKNFLLISQDPLATTRDGVRCLPWATFLETLWGGGLF